MNRMKFYFYTNMNMMFDFLARNIIAPEPIVKDIKGYRTIATASDHFLFVTHKKLNRKSREQGITDPLVCPVTLELSEPQEKDGKAVLVSKCDTGLEYKLASLREYDEKKHIGAYLIGEIPLSRVEKIYFDTQDDQDRFFRPSPDYWYPTDKFALLPEDFAEEFTIEPEEDKIIEVIEASDLKEEDIIPSLRRREKKRAALLNFVNGTKKWQYDRYVFNIDDSLQRLLQLKDEDVAAVLPHYAEVKGKGNNEDICLAGELSKPSKEINQIIYNVALETLIDQPYDTQRPPEQISKLLNDLCDTITSGNNPPKEAASVRRSIAEIEKLITDASNKAPEEIMADISEDIDVLKALLFVAKNPDRYDMFLESLDAYHADLITRRRAAVLWGALNGLYGMPGEDFNKDNQLLWQFIEAHVYNHEETVKPSLHVETPDTALIKGVVLGITLKEERIVTAGEIREAILATPKEKLTDTFYGKLLDAAIAEAGSKKKAENRGYSHRIASIPLPEIKKGDELNASIRKDLERLIKDCKSPVPNEQKLFTDYVENESKFASVFDMDQSYWKSAFKIAPEKKNA